MKKLLIYILCAVMLFSFCGNAFAKSNQMEEGVPVWQENTVRHYALDYIAGTEMTRLWNYFDLQIRRYLPQEAFENFLIDLEFMTGDFQVLGSYRYFEEPENQLKTHVLHLCMEKTDIDMYFTHKDKEDDWEVMALEFVPAEEETLPSGFYQIPAAYSEMEVTVGTPEYPLKGMLTLPADASSSNRVPACIFVHDFGPADMNMTLGNTAMFKDLAVELAEMGIASIRFDKRSYAYSDMEPSTLWEEVVEDALSAVQALHENECIDLEHVVVMGIGLGAMTAPRIASQAEGKVAGVIMIGGVLDSLINVEYERANEYLNSLSESERSNEQYIARNFQSMTKEKAQESHVLGRNAYYYWEADQYSQTRLLRNLSIPAFIGQGNRDPFVTDDEGRRAYIESLGYASYITYESFRGLNHLLMDDLTVNTEGQPEYMVETHVDKYAARVLGNWILSLKK